MIEVAVPFITSYRFSIISQYCNNVTVYSVILIVIRICLVWNINPDTVPFREALH